MIKKKLQYANHNHPHTPEEIEESTNTAESAVSKVEVFEPAVDGTDAKLKELLASL